MQRDQAKALVEEIVDLLKEAEVPAAAVPTAFDHLWNELKPKEGAGGGSAANGKDATNLEGPHAALAQRTGVNATLLEDLYAVEDDILAVRVPASRLPKSKAAATLALALLTCAGREASGLTETPTSVLRDVCSHYGVYDSPNFASTLKSGDANWQISGKGQSKNYKLRQPGWEKAGQVIGGISEDS